MVIRTNRILSQHQDWTAQRKVSFARFQLVIAYCTVSCMLWQCNFGVARLTDLCLHGMSESLVIQVSQPKDDLAH